MSEGQPGLHPLSRRLPKFDRETSDTRYFLSEWAWHYDKTSPGDLEGVFDKNQATHSDLT